MTLTEFIKHRGLKTKWVTQALGISRQALDHYGKRNDPSLRTLLRLAEAMTSLGAPTTVADIIQNVKFTAKGE